MKGKSQKSEKSPAVTALESELAELKAAVKSVLPILYRAVEFQEYNSDDYRAYDKLCRLVEDHE